MTQFTCGTKICAGPGALSVLETMKCERVMVVTDPFFEKNGVAERIARSCCSGQWEVFSQVRPDPDVALAALGAAAVRRFEPQLVVALGGGSAMDCAKAMLYFSDCAARLVAIPTTSGSGSEVTDFAVLTHEGVKIPLVDAALRPEVAILEERLLAELPKKLIADAGFDVLAHALEAAVASNAGAISTALALAAFAMAFENLGASYEGNAQVRLQVHLAATMAGMAFSQAGLGLCHAMAHALGGKYHIAHGRLNAILLPAVIGCNRCADAGYATAARAAGLGSGSDTMAVRNLKNALVRLRRQMRLPASLSQAGVLPRQVEQDREGIIRAVLEDPCCKSNPRPVDAALVHQVLCEVM